MANEIITKQFEDIQVEIIEVDGEPMFEIYSTGMALGQVKQNSIGKDYPRRERIDENIKSAEIVPCVHNGHSYISEEQLYDLMLEMKTEKVKPFRKWVTSEVLPSIRKNGGYIANQENLTPEEIVANAVVVAQKIIAAQKERLEAAEKQNKALTSEVCYKEDVIVGLVEDIDLATKRQRITQIVRHNSTNYQDRYALLYKEFERKYHVDLKRRMDSLRYGEIVPKIKNKVDYIDRCMDMIPQLYELTCKLFENDVEQLKKEWEVTITN